MGTHVLAAPTPGGAPSLHIPDAPTERSGEVTSVLRALDLLDALDGSELGLVELGRRTGLKPSTTHRMLATLSQRGFVVRADRTGKYRLGRRAASLRMDRWAQEVRIKACGGPILHRLGLVARETCHLSVPDGGEAVFIAQVPARESITPVLHEELRMPSHATASGKAMLAFLEPELLGVGSLPALTDRTIVDPEPLAGELEEIRERGYAVDRKEVSSDLACVAAPVFGREGKVVAALSVTGAVGPILGALEDHGELVSGFAAEASTALGHELVLA